MSIIINQTLYIKTESFHLVKEWFKNNREVFDNSKLCKGVQLMGVFPRMFGNNGELLLSWHIENFELLEKFTDNMLFSQFKDIRKYIDHSKEQECRFYSVEIA